MKLENNSSPFHKRYLQNIKKEKRWVLIFQVIILITFFTLWELASRLHWIDPLIFSSPTKVWNLFIIKLQDGSLYMHTAVTVYETILGFILGTLFGAILAGILWWSPKLSKIMDPYLVIFNAMPKVAFGPMLIVIFGTGLNSSIAMGIIISVIVTTIVVYTAFRDVDPNYIKVLKTFGATRYQIFKEAILPATFPTIISTLKVNVGLSWVGVIVGEYLVASKGLGYLIIYGFQVFNFTLVMLSLMIVAVIATLMYQLVDLLEKKLVKSDS
ncbi:ABC transporter permease [Heyndrickxia sp. NPDC080065]|uniref:ABC transporter permease n=1 Tax=Heyndrickxia sp. NPDC080065 TaxID=3390568 RepID=UPI003D080E40